MHDSVSIDDPRMAVRLGPPRASALAAVIGALCSTLCLAAPAAAQSSSDPPPDSEPIDVRVRGGFSGGTGVLAVWTPQEAAIAPSFHFSGRFGVQIGSIFSLYYQNMPTIVVATDGSGMAILDYNSALADVTLANRVGLAFGPSADVVAVTAGSVSAHSVLFGLHSRLAFYLSGHTTRPGSRRSGLSLGIDAHPTFGPGGTFLAVQIGLGYEWY